jgi:hypothetical protein
MSCGPVQQHRQRHGISINGNVIEIYELHKIIGKYPKDHSKNDESEDIASISAGYLFSIIPAPY